MVSMANVITNLAQFMARAAKYGCMPCTKHLMNEDMPGHA